MNWIALAAVSALLSAAAAITQKRVLLRASALEFSFLSTCAVLVLSLAIPATTGVLLEPRAWLLVAGKSVLGGMGFLLVMKALEANEISNALPLMGLTPAVTALLATVLLGQPLQGGEWVGLALMASGTWMLESRARGTLAAAWREALVTGRHRWMIGAIALFALSSVADKLLVSGMRVPPFVVLFHQHVVYAALFGGMLLVRRVPGATLVARAREHAPWLLAIAVLTIGYRWFQLEATREGPVALVLAVKRTSIVVASLVGGRLFRDERVAPRVIGGALIVAAGFLFLGRE